MDCVVESSIILNKWKKQMSGTKYKCFCRNHNTDKRWKSASINKVYMTYSLALHS